MRKQVAPHSDSSATGAAQRKTITFIYLETSGLGIITHPPDLFNFIVKL